MVIEKGGEIGNHGFSGAVVDPKALHELFPDEDITGGLDTPVTSDALWFLTNGGKIKAPFTPPVMNNHGKYVASLSNLTKWLAAKAEEAGVDVFPAFPGQELLWDGDRVVGVRIGDKGVAHDGTHKSNYEPGPDLMAKVVVLGEGPRGTLTKTAIARLGLDKDRDPQVYAVGIKELWRVPGRLRRGQRDPHARRAAVEHVRRRLDLRHDAATSSTSAWSPVSTTPTRRPIRTTTSSATSCTRRSARCSKAAR